MRFGILLHVESNCMTASFHYDWSFGPMKLTYPVTFYGSVCTKPGLYSERHVLVCWGFALSTILIFHFGVVLTVWYFLFFILLDSLILTASISSIKKTIVWLLVYPIGIHLLCSLDRDNGRIPGDRSNGQCPRGILYWHFVNMTFKVQKMIYNNMSKLTFYKTI